MSLNKDLVIREDKNNNANRGDKIIRSRMQLVLFFCYYYYSQVKEDDTR